VAPSGPSDDRERRQRVLALTDQVMKEHAWTLERLASWDLSTILLDGNERGCAPDPGWRSSIGTAKR
jgi:hypothetical protein